MSNLVDITRKGLVDLTERINLNEGSTRNEVDEFLDTIQEFIDTFPFRGIDEHEEMSADLKRKEPEWLEAEKQEEFCN